MSFRLGDADRPVQPPARRGPPEVRQVSLPATITAFHLPVETGALETAEGTRLEFGRSACKGFEPVVGARVVVEAIASYPEGGARATLVRRDLTDRTYDARLAERDAALGLPPRPSAAQAAAEAGKLAQIIVLLDEPVAGPGALGSLLASLPAPAGEFAIAMHAASASVKAPARLGGHLFQLSLGAAPFPDRELDRSRVDAGFQLGAGFIGICYGLPGFHARTRAIAGGDLPSLWSPTGKARVTAMLVRALLARARGVVLPGAGMLVWSAGEFDRMLGDLDDPDSVPVHAWIDVAYNPELAAHATFGLPAFALPEVIVPSAKNDAWTTARAREALQLAASRMVRTDAPLAAGDVLQVPYALRAGAYLPDATGDGPTYDIHERDRWLVLVPQPGQRDPRDLPLAEVGAGAYVALYDHTMSIAFPDATLVYETRAEGELAVPVRLQIHRGADGRYSVGTVGLGHRPQPGVDEPDDDDRHVELLAFCQGAIAPLLADGRRRAWLCRALSGLAAIVGARPDHPVRSFDGVPLLQPQIDLGGFVFGVHGVVTGHGNHRITLLAPIPCGVDEYARIRSESARTWFDRNPLDTLDDRWPELLSRI